MRCDLSCFLVQVWFSCDLYIRVCDVSGVCAWCLGRWLVFLHILCLVRVFWGTLLLLATREIFYLVWEFFYFCYLSFMFVYPVRYLLPICLLVVSRIFHFPLLLHVRILFVSIFVFCCPVLWSGIPIVAIRAWLSNPGIFHDISGFRQEGRQDPDHPE